MVCSVYCIENQYLSVNFFNSILFFWKTTVLSIRFRYCLKKPYNLDHILLFKLLASANEKRQ
jgi:hypothetical protein